MTTILPTPTGQQWISRVTHLNPIRHTMTVLQAVLLLVLEETVSLGASQHLILTVVTQN